MTKIKSIRVTNFKALENQEIELNGASVIVTAGNNKGKTSFLRGLVDRFRGEKPEIIVKEGEEKGVSTMELTDGSKIEWRFTHKTENFSFTTAEDIKMTTGVLSAIGEKYFGVKFDIDKFIQTSKTESLKMVEKLVGLDFTELNDKYRSIFDERTEVNRDLKNLRAKKLVKPEEVVVADIESLKLKKQAILDANEELRKKWLKENEEFQKDTIEFNNKQDERKKRRDNFINDWRILEQFEDEDEHEINSFIDFEAISRFYDKMEEPETKKEVKSLPEPTYQSLDEIEKSIEEAYENKSKADAYEKELKEYNHWVEEGEKTAKKAQELTNKLTEINDQKAKMVSESNLPDDFEISEDGILYKGLPIDENQISSSAKYICALKLGSLVLGKVKAMHFDASFLDKNSLKEIQEWAEENDLQLLIERPDWEGGEIKYEIIQEIE